MNTSLREKTGYKKDIGLKTVTTEYENMAQRPMTNYGLEGVKPVTSQGKRQIISTSYYMQLLKKRVEDLSNEIAGFKYEKGRLEKDIELKETLEKLHKKLTSEVRDLEGTLADYNLSFDKYRTGTKADDIMGIKDHIS